MYSLMQQCLERESKLTGTEMKKHGDPVECELPVWVSRRQADTIQHSSDEGHNECDDAERCTCLDPCCNHTEWLLKINVVCSEVAQVPSLCDTSMYYHKPHVYDFMLPPGPGVNTFKN